WHAALRRAMRRRRAMLRPRVPGHTLHRRREAIHADHDDRTAVDALLLPIRRFLDLALHDPRFDGGERTAEPIDPRVHLPRLTLDRIGHRFERVRAAQGIDRVRHAALVRDDLLRP